MKEKGVSKTESRGQRQHMGPAPPGESAIQNKLEIIRVFHHVEHKMGKNFTRDLPYKDPS